MPEFTYVGVSRQGKKVQGKAHAANEGELRMLLRGQGVRPTRIGKVSVLNADLAMLFSGGKIGRIPVGPLAIFTRQLHILVSSGIPLVQSLEILQEQVVDPNLKRLIPLVKEEVSGGSFLWEALNKNSQAFPRIYISLIRAAETSGAMESILNRLSKYLEDSQRLLKMVKSAMTYPLIVFSIGLLIVWGMLTFVIPKFKDLVVNSGGELPWPTQLVINISNFLNNNFLQFLGVLVVGFFLLRKYFLTKEGKAVKDRIVFRLPIFSELAKKAGVARFTRTMSILLASGVTLIDAIEICKETLDNAVLEEAVVNVRKSVEGGKAFGGTLALLPIFPKMAVHMISVGEATGNLEKMLEKVADVFESDVETMVEGMSKLVEPFILVFLGGMIAAIMIAMYLPIFKMAGGGA